jgi:cell wall-associated NlpC family hydrolase
VPAELQFALASDPSRALDNAGLALQAQQNAQNLLTELKTTKSALRARTDEAAAELERLRASRRAMATQRRTIERHIAEAKALESSLAAKERARLAALEKQESDRAQAKWESTGILDKVGTDATAAGRKALAFAARQIGKPYVWGAEGPDSFDCSGLTSQAWLAAGVTIPRTSEMQWAQLKHVPVEEMRPGDLIIYFSDASHVAIYAGGGNIISAPRPGRYVYESPAASMQILGVVRPAEAAVRTDRPGQRAEPASSGASPACNRRRGLPGPAGSAWSGSGSRGASRQARSCRTRRRCRSTPPRRATARATGPPPPGAPTSGSTTGPGR